MKLKLNQESFRDKIHGCWIGKNIGGTMGAPYEGKKNVNDISGFSSPKGEPLPNDDLDLQLVWLRAVETINPKDITANDLAEYWLSYIPPHWSEYGICKSNINMGLLPPLCGEVNNIWKNSNGAWIRSEIWGCLAPGVPNIAVKYAIMDASVDHGLAEGTYAEMFTASLESMAFFENDIETLIKRALTFIPESCRVARAVRLVMDCYKNNVSWKETRELIVKDSEDLGWFQAPGNIAFVILGLLYGEGDYKKSLIYTINCGDDADCTGATIGSILGIIKGASGIPEDWKEYIGDRIFTVCINKGSHHTVPDTCTELTQRVIDAIPRVMNAYNIDVEFVDGMSEIDNDEASKILEGYVEKMFLRSPYSFEIPDLLHTSTFVEYEKEPKVKPGDTFNVKVTMTNIGHDPRHYEVDVFLPDGWMADYSHTCYLHHENRGDEPPAVDSWEMTITVGEKVSYINRIPVMFSSSAHALPIMIPIVLLG